MIRWWTKRGDNHISSATFLQRWAVSTLASSALQVWDCFSIIAAWGLGSDHRARLSLRATQGRKCFPWQMHVELPPERITATISVTPSLISELIGLLSNGQRCARHYGKKMWWMYAEYGVQTFHTIWEFTMDRSTHSCTFAARRLNIILFNNERHSTENSAHAAPDEHTVIPLVCFVYVSIISLHKKSK